MSDLTAKARIRNAAMQLFGEVGYERATTRAIAERAGVTSGLIRHHYGSKEKLLAACDERIIDLIRKLEARAEAGAGGLSPLQSIGPYRQYLARALFEGRAAAVFDHMVASTQKWLTLADQARSDPPDIPVRARATVQTAFALAVGMLAPHISRGLDVDITTPAGNSTPVTNAADGGTPASSYMGCPLPPGAVGPVAATRLRLRPPGPQTSGAERRLVGPTSVERPSPVRCR
ncbi:TetR/AcrR family transcriptional regulator [Nonomuraea lactucae]|uniref:TetR/AcrR family transcriptional regulator n=1 Tax=Nonomuraea lactucae TaxID=2249762 RepID=UPI0013B3CA1F|nr:helix-turn-helix domain-containing protein [Nonomuraea lactucae]